MGITDRGYTCFKQEWLRLRGRSIYLKDYEKAKGQSRCCGKYPGSFCMRQSATGWTQNLPIGGPDGGFYDAKTESLFGCETQHRCQQLGGTDRSLRPGIRGKPDHGGGSVEGYFGYERADILDFFFFVADPFYIEMVFREKMLDGCFESFVLGVRCFLRKNNVEGEPLYEFRK